MRSYQGLAVPGQRHEHIPQRPLRRRESNWLKPRWPRLRLRGPASHLLIASKPILKPRHLLPLQTSLKQLELWHWKPEAEDAEQLQTNAEPELVFGSQEGPDVLWLPCMDLLSHRLPIPSPLPDEEQEKGAVKLADSSVFSPERVGWTDHTAVPSSSNPQQEARVNRKQLWSGQHGHQATESAVHLASPATTLWEGQKPTLVPPDHLQQHPHASQQPLPLLEPLSPHELHMLSRDISEASSWVHVNTIVQAHLSQFSGTHFSSAFVCLAKLYPSKTITLHPPGLSQLMTALTSAIPAHLDSLGSLEISNIVWAMGTLLPGPAPAVASSQLPKQVPCACLPSPSHPIQPPPPLFSHGYHSAMHPACSCPTHEHVLLRDVQQALVARFQPFLGKARPEQFSNMMWGLARVELRPSSKWMRSFMSRSFKLLQRTPAAIPSCNHRTTASALTREGSPAAPSVGLRQGHASSGTKALGSKHTSECSGTDDESSGLKSGQPDFGSSTFSTVGLCNTLCALAKLNFRPSKCWAVAFFSAWQRVVHPLTHATMSAPSSGSSSKIASSRASLFVSQPYMPSAAVHNYSASVQASISGSETSTLPGTNLLMMCKMLKAAMSLSLQPGEAFMVQLYATLETQISSLDARQLGRVLKWIGQAHRKKLLPGVVPRPLLLLCASRLELIMGAAIGKNNATDAEASGFNGDEVEQVSVTNEENGEAGDRPGKPLSAQKQAADGPSSMRQSRAADDPSMGHSMASDGPSMGYSRATSGASRQSRGTGAYIQALVDSAWAFAVIGHTPPKTWTSLLLASTRSCCQAGLAGCSLTHLLWALSRLDAAVPQDWLDDVTTAAARLALPESMSLGQLAGALEAVGGMKRIPSHSFVIAALDAAYPLMHSASPSQLAQLSGACASLSVQPQGRWLGRLLSLLVGHRTRIHSAQASMLLTSLETFTCLREKLPGCVIAMLLERVIPEAAIPGVWNAELAANALWAVARWGFRPSAQWMNSCKSMIMRCTKPAHMCPAAAVRFLAAAAELKLWPDAATMRHLLTIATLNFKALSHEDISTLITAVRHLDAAGVLALYPQSASSPQGASSQQGFCSSQGASPQQSASSQQGFRSSQGASPQQSTSSRQGTSNDTASAPDAAQARGQGLGSELETKLGDKAPGHGHGPAPGHTHGNAPGHTHSSGAGAGHTPVPGPGHTHGFGAGAGPRSTPGPAPVHTPVHWPGHVHGSGSRSRNTPGTVSGQTPGQTHRSRAGSGHTPGSEPGHTPVPGPGRTHGFGSGPGPEHTPGSGPGHTHRVGAGAGRTHGPGPGPGHAHAHGPEQWPEGVPPNQMLFRRIHPQLASCPIRSLIHLGICLRNAGMMPSPQWCQEYEAATEQKLAQTCVTPVDRVALLGSLLHFHRLPSPAWMAIWYAATASQAKSLTAKQMLVASALAHHVAKNQVALDAAAAQTAGLPPPPSDLPCPPLEWLAALEEAAAASATSTASKSHTHEPHSHTRATHTPHTSHTHTLATHTPHASHTRATRTSHTHAQWWGPSELLLLSAQVHDCKYGEFKHMQVESGTLRPAVESRLAHLLRPAAPRSSPQEQRAWSQLQNIAVLQSLHSLTLLPPPAYCGPLASGAVTLMQQHLLMQPFVDIFKAAWKLRGLTGDQGEGGGTSQGAGNSNGSRPSSASPAPAPDPLDYMYPRLRLDRMDVDTSYAWVASDEAAEEKLDPRALAVDPVTLLLSMMENLVVWRNQPPPKWLDSCVQLVSAHAHELSGEELVRALNAMALLRAEPSLECVRKLLHGRHASLGASCSPNELVDVVWALSMFGRDPGPDWWGAYELVLQASTAEARKLPKVIAGTSISAAGVIDTLSLAKLASLSLSLANLRRRPSLTFMARLLAAAAPRLSNSSPDDLAKLLYALGELEEVPNVAWMDLYLAETEARMETSSVDHLAMYATGLVSMRRKPRQEWVRCFLDRSASLVQEFRGFHLARILSALAGLDCHPPFAWLAMFVDAVQARAAELDASMCAELSWALHRLGMDPLGELRPAAAGAVDHSVPLAELVGELAGKMVPPTGGSVGHSRSSRSKATAPRGARSEAPGRPQLLFRGQARRRQRLSKVRVAA